MRSTRPDADCLKSMAAYPAWPRSSGKKRPKPPDSLPRLLVTRRLTRLSSRLEIRRQIESFALILGVLPLVIGQGAGAEMRRSLGTAVFSGMIGVTLFGIFLTPVFYFVIQWMTGGDGAAEGESCDAGARGTDSPRGRAGGIDRDSHAGVKEARRDTRSWERRSRQED
jgi:AcrB/AcrD/AcrF family